MRSTIALLLATSLVASSSTDAFAQSSAFITARSGTTSVQDAIATAIRNIQALRDGLPLDIASKRRQQTAFDSSIILLGIASVAGALYRASLPAIGGIGLAAAGLSEYRSYYNPEGEGAAYIAAERSARCVTSTAEPLLAAQPQLTWDAIANLRLAIAQVNASAGALDTTTATGQAGSDAASQAIAAANSAMAALNAESGAYNSAAGVIDGAHDAIKDYLDKANHRASPDFATIQTQLNASISAQAASTSQSETARSQLLSAYQAQAKSQAVSGNVANAPAAQTSAPPTNLAEANAVQPVDAAKVQVVQQQADAAAASGPNAAAAVNSKQVSALIAATAAALQQMPNPQFTTINTAIAVCTSGLS